MSINIELHENFDGSLDGRYKQGNKPITGGGTPALAWSAPQGLADGNTLTITTDGTNPFGATAPDFIFLLDAYALPDGQMTYADLELGTNATMVDNSDVALPSSTAAFDVVSDSRIGKAVKMGTTTAVASDVNGTAYPTGRMRCLHPRSTKSFDSRMYYWPAANQANAESYLASGNLWQFKPIWNGSGQGASGNTTDFFINSGNQFSNPEFQNHLKVSSNSVPTEYLTLTNSTVNQADTYKRPYAEVYHLEAAWDQGSADGVTYDGSVRVVQSTDSRFLNDVTQTGMLLSESTAVDPVLYGFTYPGYVRGFSIPDNMHMLEGDVYKSVGSGAFCRVAITDNSDYFSAHKRCLLRPLSWANGEITAKFRSGIFQGDLTGCYLNIIGINNTQIGSVAL